MSQAEGYIYVAVNPSMPNLVKIGRTERPPEQRLKELSSPAGVPEEFHLVDFFPVASMQLAEKHIHEHLRRHRRNPKREFFHMSAEEAVAFVQAYMQLCQKADNTITDAGVPWAHEDWLRQMRRNVMLRRERLHWQAQVAADAGDPADEAVAAPAIEEQDPLFDPSSSVRSGSRKAKNQRRRQWQFKPALALALATALAIASFAVAYTWFTRTFFQQTLGSASAGCTLARHLEPRKGEGVPLPVPAADQLPQQPEARL